MYRVLEAFSLNATLIFTLILIRTCVCMSQLSFRNARKSLLGVKLQVRHLLHIPEVLGPAHGGRSSSFDAAAGDSLALDPAIRELDDVISVYLRKTVDRFDLTRNYEAR